MDMEQIKQRLSVFWGSRRKSCEGTVNGEKEAVVENTAEVPDEGRREQAACSLALTGSGRPIRLQFEGLEKIHHSSVQSDDLDKYPYTLNGREYTGVSCLNAKDKEKECMEGIADFAYITEDIYNQRVLCMGSYLPTFDSADREWDSRSVEYLMFDGRNINLIVMRGGYRIASLTFYTRLASADIALKPWLESLGFPTDGVEWRE